MDLKNAAVLVTGGSCGIGLGKVASATDRRELKTATEQAGGPSR
jgi:short-subunit dehydrogenase involved in D-alanine esterification of teichoic acids